MKQVFLHIGVHKTGSSSIQFFLHRNREQLARLGYLYPSQKRAHHNLAFTLRSHPQADYQSDTWEDVIDEIESADLEKIILSSESFVEDITLEFIKQVGEKLKNYQTKIIIYLKRQDKKIESHLTQRIKTGAAVTDIGLYIDRELAIDYLEIVNNWSRVFGKDNIIVKPFEKAQIEDLYQNFLASVGINSIEGFKQTVDINIRPSLAQIIGTNFINQQLENTFEKSKRKSYRLAIKSNVEYPKSFFKYTQHWQSKSKYNLIPYDKAREILKNSQEQNSLIAKKFLNREDECLFYEPLDLYEYDSLNINQLDKQQLIDLCSYLFLLNSV
jgi:hypothetical protein